jgi:hypothetical protein
MVIAVPSPDVFTSKTPISTKKVSAITEKKRIVDALTEYINIVSSLDYFSLVYIYEIKFKFITVKGKNGGISPPFLPFLSLLVARAAAEYDYDCKNDNPSAVVIKEIA